MTSLSLAPKDITVDGFVGSGFKCTEAEIVACNIVLIHQWACTNWTPFSWEEYQARCKHNVTDAERVVLEAMVNGGKAHWSNSHALAPGYLLKVDDKYVVTEQFVAAIPSQSRRSAA